MPGARGSPPVDVIKLTETREIAPYLFILTTNDETR
jgi:hypothetical protein